MSGAWNTMSVATARRDDDAPRSVTLSLPKPPSTNNLFVNHPHGRGRFPSGEYKNWKRDASKQVRFQRPGYFRGPVTVLLVIDEKNRCDRDNLIKAPLDLMVELGIIEGDKPTIVKEITVRSGQVDGALITITKFDDDGPLFQKGARG